MFPAALLRDGANMAHDPVRFEPTPPPIDDTLTIEQREAQRIADQAASFCLFGLRIALEEDAWRDAAEPYLAAADAPPAPANDPAHVAPATTFAFPKLGHRGVHASPRLPMQALRVIDWAAVLLIAHVAALWGVGAGLFALSLGEAAAFLLAAGALKAGLWLTETYRATPATMRPEGAVGGLALGVIAGIIFANLIAPDARASAALATTLPIAAMLLAGIHAAIAVWSNAAHKKGVFSENVVIIGATDAAKRIIARAKRSGDMRVVAVVDDRLSRVPSKLSAAPVGGNIDDLMAWDGLPHVDRIIITVTQKAETRVRAMIERLRPIPNRVDLLLDYQNQGVQGRRVERLNGTAVACVSGRPHNYRRAMIKRASDLIIGGAMLVGFAIPMLIIAIAIKCDSKGPILYRQQRHGFNNRVFTVFKFRTMRVRPEEKTLVQVQAADPRITRLGRFLRKTSLDELPQLLNVMLGDMSLVGPRPHAVGMKTAERDLQHIVAEYAHRHRVKPGLTGWAQINGSRGPVEKPAELRRRVKLDLEYVSNASLWLDLQILLRTAPSLLGDKEATR